MLPDPMHNALEHLEAASWQKESEARSSTHEWRIYVYQRIKAQVIISEGEYDKEEGLFVTK